MCSFIFTQFWRQKNYIHPHKPDYIRTSPNTIFSDGMCRIKAYSVENCLKMLSDQKLSLTKLRPPYAEILIICRLDYLLMAGGVGLFIIHPGVLSMKNNHTKIAIFHRNPWRGELAVFNVWGQLDDNSTSQNYTLCLIFQFLLLYCNKFLDGSSNLLTHAQSTNHSSNHCSVNI